MYFLLHKICLLPDSPIFLLFQVACSVHNGQKKHSEISTPHKYM